MKLSTVIRFILNFFDFFQQKKVIKFFKKNLGKKILILDVGSHHGETISLFSKNFELFEFHCFEASPINFKFLVKNIEKLNFKNKSQSNLVNVGIGSRKGNTFINQIKESSSSTINELNLESNYLKKKMKILNINKSEKFYKKIPISIIKLDDYIESKEIKEIDILKIDTEGYELNVVKGLQKYHKIIKYIYFEHHYDDMIKKNYTFSNINLILKSFGFKKVFKTKMFFRKSFEYIYANKSI